MSFKHFSKKFQAPHNQDSRESTKLSNILKLTLISLKVLILLDLAWSEMVG